MKSFFIWTSSDEQSMLCSYHAKEGKEELEMSEKGPCCGGLMFLGKGRSGGRGGDEVGVKCR